MINALAAPKYSGAGYKGVFITSASQIDPQALALAASKNISVLQGENVVDMIFSNLDRLDPSIVSGLGIYSAPALFSYKK
ncbi:MAG: hypothetical protein HDQ91_03270 [Desulfovibrio sp.]|nr:hypothetical protein [Desulfovibrio sp.]